MPLPATRPVSTPEPPRLRILPVPATPVPVREVRAADQPSPARFTWRAVFAAPRYSVPAALLLVGHQIGEALVPVIMGIAIDRAVATGDLGQLILWIAALAGVFLAFSFCYRMGSRLGFLAMDAVTHHLRMRLSDRLLDPRGSTGPTRLTGYSLSVATSDAERVGRAVLLGVWPAGELAAVVVGGGVLLVLAWPLGVAVLVGVPLLLFLLDRAGAPLRRRSATEQEMAARAAGRAADLMAGYRVVAGLGAGGEAARRYRDVSQDALEATLHAKRSQGTYVGALTLVTGLFVTGITVAAGLIAVNGGLSVGELITVVGLTQFLIAPLTNFATNAGAIWAAAQASAERALGVLTAPHALPAGEGTTRTDSAAPVPTVDQSPGDLVLDGLRVGGLEPIHEVVESGTTVAVLLDGADAEALADVLALRAAPVAGAVRLGALEVTGSPEPDVVRRHLLVAPHSADLVDGTVEENVVLEERTRGRRDAAARAAQCEDVLHALAQGWQTQVGEGGVRLSGGQRQRVALARALAQDPPVLVLHDPTTAVDSVTEAGIAAALREARAGRTTVLLTRSPVLSAVADVVIRPESLPADGEEAP